jgi:hypothetical protein
MAGGALFLFLINGVFIAASSLAVARVLRLPAVTEIDAGTRSLHRAVIGVGLTVVLVPSVWMGYRLVQDEVFQGAAERSLAQLERDTGTALLGREIDPRARAIRLTVVGEAEQARLQAAVGPLLVAQRIGDATLEFRRAGDAQWQAMRRRGDERDQQVAKLAAELQLMTQRQDTLAAERTPRADALLHELQVWLPQLHGLSLSDSSGGPRELRLRLTQALQHAELQRLHNWLAARVGGGAFTVIQETGPAPAKP